MKNLIGLEQQPTNELVEELNALLADYQVLYMNTRGYHWNIQGKQFFELHVKFEEMYTDLQLKVDELAERILTLGARPNHTFSQYLALSEIHEHKDASRAEDCVKGLLDAFQLLITKQRGIAEKAAEIGDEGTVALMSDYIREQEKTTWMLNAYLQ
ncbi:Dps family protein [Photobacterium aphoticum]|uniref:DNA polymerase sliding clamp subunit n=1 Tax=Photobacterium aphoticum TaxID=754436 RepID=A0A0J1GIN3_9GAMM|nr:Dps family protein [Photobacterium aphoticum]KLU99577.1 DNA polymerase sliding clamp subunit [Photobacterium aphoticum]PSU56057.1 DNA starvation/stationary phase protection protein [Photobacterium aphoticum]GHA53504.1 DNA starvation/stationary phase protection protein [Photobacterium aphoticum]